MSSYRHYSSPSTRYPPSTYGSSYVSSDPFWEEDEEELLFGGRTYHRAIPGIAHKRMTMVTPPPHSVKANRIYTELERAAHRPRLVNTSPLPEELVVTPNMVEFDYADYEPNVWSPISAGLHLQTILNEKIRDIRMQAQMLLDKQNPSRFDPPIRRPMVYYTTSQYEAPEPPKHEPDYKVYTLRDAQRDVQEHIHNKSHYGDSARRANIGKGHLSCMTYAGGKAQPTRRQKYFEQVNPDKVKNEVAFLSYYDKTQSEVNRQYVDSQRLRHQKVPYGDTSVQGLYSIRTYPIATSDIVNKKEEPVPAAETAAVPAEADTGVATAQPTETEAAPEKLEAEAAAVAEAEVAPPAEVEAAPEPPKPVEAEVAPPAEVEAPAEPTPVEAEAAAAPEEAPAAVEAVPAPTEEAPKIEETSTSAEPEAPVAATEAPVVETEAPVAETVAVAPEPEAPAAEPEVPAAETVALATEPEVPVEQVATAAVPEAPTAVPEATAAEPEAPAAVEAPVAVPEDPAVVPEGPAVEAEAPAPVEVQPAATDSPAPVEASDESQAPSEAPAEQTPEATATDETPAAAPGPAAE